MTKIVNSTKKPPRVSVPLSDEVHKVFQRLAKAGNMSTGRAIAEWLADTVEAVEFVALTMEKARAAPKIVMREMHAYALGLADETGELMRNLAEKGKGRKVERPSGRTSDAPSPIRPVDGPIPPPCNTGGKLPINLDRPLKKVAKVLKNDTLAKKPKVKK
jgi:predicted transcriptional regulator